MTYWPALPAALCLLLGSPAIADDEPDALFAEEADKSVEEAQPQADAEALGGDDVAEDAVAEVLFDEDAEPTPEALRQRAQALSRELQEVQTELRQLDMPQGNGRAPVGLIENITLPDNPTRADCEVFIEELAEATQGQNAFSTNDPQVQKLSQIPPEHIDLLIGATSGRSPLRYHASYAMREMDFSNMRSRIDTLLRDQPALIGLVVNQGWALDARDAIRDKIIQRPANLGMAWFQAASELNDPALYAAIHDCVLQARNYSQVVLMLESMADYDVERTVSALWLRNRVEGSSGTRYQVALIAVRFGYVDALEELVSQLAQRGSYYYNNNGENTYDTQRAMVMRYIDYSGSVQEIARWIAEHRDELVFDHVTQRYLLPEQLERF
ncbi:MAG: hypothetical protein AAGA29_09360 [Planctomycetota bacterium]